MLYYLLAMCLVGASLGAQECGREVIFSFFPELFVKKTLTLYKVPLDLHEAILSALTEKESQVTRVTEDKGAKLKPNPLRDPNRHAEAVALFRETRLELFSEVLRAHGITDPKIIQEMLEHIHKQRSVRRDECGGF